MLNAVIFNNRHGLRFKNNINFTATARQCH